MDLPSVLHVIPSLRIGGAERTLAGLVTAKRETAYSQTVVSLMPAGELAEPIRAAGIAVHELGINRLVDAPLGLARLRTLVRELKPRAIQSWLYYADLLSLWALELSGRRNATRLYWGVRCSDMDQAQYGAALRSTIAACARRAARPDAVVANSFAGRSTHRMLGYTPRAFPVIPNGIDTAQFRPDAALRARSRAELGFADNELVVIHVARVDPMKDHASLLKTAAALPAVRFLAVGQGTQDLAGPPNLMALGQRRDLAALYPAADLALSTSAFGEGFPNVIGEAMACGLPVVATDTGDSRSIVGDTGMIVPPRNNASMAAALQALAAQPETERRQRGLRCRERIDTHYSLDRAVAAFDRLHRDGILPPDTQAA